MLRFKRFILEDMPYLDDEYDVDPTEADHRVQEIEYKLRSIKAAAGGKPLQKVTDIGSYELHHVPSEFTSPSSGRIYRRHHYVVKHKSKPIGVVDFSEEEPVKIGSEQLERHLSAQGPTFHPKHTGRRSEVPHLASRVYQTAAQHLNMPIVSGARQSRGGQNLWANLARMGRVRMISQRGVERIDKYNPDNPEHVAMAYPRLGQTGHYRYLVHHPESKK
jgi:hypothetical protein